MIPSTTASTAEERGVAADSQLLLGVPAHRLPGDRLAPIFTWPDEPVLDGPFFDERVDQQSCPLTGRKTFGGAIRDGEAADRVSPAIASSHSLAECPSFGTRNDRQCRKAPDSLHTHPHTLIALP